MKRREAEGRDEDRTARSRIRDAAVDLFGTRGYEGTSIRDVARQAGVSPGLVQHHFGSKAELREACGAHVSDRLRALTERKLERTRYDRDFVSSLYASSAPVTRYVARGLVEGWPGMEAVFDQVAADSARWLSGTWPDRFPEGSGEARTHGGVWASMALGTLVLHGHLGRWAGVDPLEPGQEHVCSAAMVELITRMAEFFQMEAGRSMKSALAEYARTVRESAAGEGDGDA